MTDVTLLGRVLIAGRIRTVTGLHIGGSPGALAIGNVDMPVIRDVVTGRPYIPGSSLKGKMRSLAEKVSGAPQNKSIGRDVTIHVAADRDQYEQYWVNPVFGVPGEVKFDVPAPNRLIVRDVPLDDDSAAKLLAARTDLPYTEVKWEAAIDRVTSAATPRQMERVPAGAVFARMELVFSLYLPGDVDLFAQLLTALQLVEDDYLGGQGSRGSGKIAFQELQLTCKVGTGYQRQSFPDTFGSLTDLLQNRGRVLDWIGGLVPRAR
jgi:CRISPR-associated protein Csm3